MTVERALYYAAKLRPPRDFTNQEIQQRVSEALEEVEVTDHCALLVRNHSGEQRKRIAIAIELLANPYIFFLGELTSGLNPGLDRKIMLLLRRLADRGVLLCL